MISVSAERSAPSLSPSPTLSLSLSVFIFVKFMLCVAVCYFCIIFSLSSPCDKIFSCLRTFCPGCCLLPAPPQSLSQSVSQQATAAGDNRSEACACLCPGLESPCQPEESGAIRNSLVASLARKFCYAAANLQQLP